MQFARKILFLAVTVIVPGLQLLDDDTLETKMTEQWQKRPQSSYFVDPASPFFKVSAVRLR